MKKPEKINSYFVFIGCIIFLQLSTANARGQASQILCEAFYSDSGRKLDQVEEKKISNWLKAAVTLKWGERSKALEFNNTLRLDREKLENTKARIKNAVSESLSSSSLLEVRSEQIKDDIKTTLQTILESIDTFKTQAVADLVEKRINQFIIERKQVSSDIFANVSSFNKSVESVKSANLSRLFSKAFIEEITFLESSIKHATSANEAQVLKENAIAILNDRVVEFNKKEALRKQVEARFNLEISGNSRDIAKKYSEMLGEYIGAESSIKKSIEESIDSFSTVMESSPNFKKLIYRETQILRVLAKSDKKQFQKVMEMRSKNNLDLLRKYIELTAANPKEAEMLLSTYMGLRPALRVLSSKKTYGKILPKDSMRNIGMADREKIVSEAIKSTELRYSIIGSVVALPSIYPKPLVKPTAPVKPIRPNFERMSKSSKKQARLQYKGQVDRYKSLKTQYVRDVQTYKDNKMKHMESVLKMRQVEQRRTAMRESFVMFLSENMPTLFLKNQSTSVSNIVKSNFKNRIRDRKASLSDSRRRELEDEMDRRHRLENNSMDSMDWVMMFYTGNPMWMINRDIARMQLFFDLISSPDRSHSHSYLAEGVIPREESKSLNEEQLEQRIQENADGLREYEELRGRDESMYSMAGLKADEVTLHEPIDIEADRIDAAERTIDRLNSEPGIEDTIEKGDAHLADSQEVLDKEWSSFKDTSDADWKGGVDDILDDVRGEADTESEAKGS
ncbi:MAG: hypothetical protein L6Q37_09595 [Bdellovibrionaceae bacterium]|nr:hypothetical protein [Pseudobdellovibrionaceae bacterium]NUM58305.1 hypothetical protein [Pseudobdellovibrionaceae bacterium]